MILTLKKYVYTPDLAVLPRALVTKPTFHQHQCGVCFVATRRNASGSSDYLLAWACGDSAGD